jgi:hypothetical protein
MAEVIAGTNIDDFKRTFSNYPGFSRISINWMHNGFRRTVYINRTGRTFVCSWEVWTTRL